MPAAARQIRRARVAVSLCFMVMGMGSGVLVARLPAIKADAHLTDGSLGLALFATPAGLVIGAAVAERLLDRTGSARAAWASGVGLSLLITGPGLAGDLPELMAALLAIGAVGGMLDVAQNAQGVRVENAYGRPVMSSMHACYSLGAILGSLGGGGFAWAGVGVLPSLAVAGLAGAVLVGVAGRWFLAGAAPLAGDECRAVRGAGDRPAPAPSAGGAGAAPRARTVPRSRRRVLRLVLALGVLGVCGLVGEGAAGDWSAVYLRDNLGTSAGFAALGFAAFSVMMTGGRMAGDRLMRRFGAVRLVRGCGLVAAAGLAGALATTSPVAAVAGLAVFGAGLSSVLPRVFAAGGSADPDRPGSGLARVVGLGYVGMTAGPAVIGAVASHIGLRLALAMPAVLAVWIAVAAPVIGEAGDDGRNHGPFGDIDRPLSAAGPAAAYGRHMDDKEILANINGLIETEHELRSQLAAGKLSSEQERERLRSAEEALDQCWDLLRQRRARREYGENPDGAAVRPATEVEGYQQ